MNWFWYNYVIVCDRGFYFSDVYRRFWNRLFMKYPQIEEKIPAFKRTRYKHPAPMTPEMALPRFLTLDWFRKDKSRRYYEKIYRADLIKKLNDKELNEQLRIIPLISPFADILFGVWFIIFVGVIIFSLIWMFIS